MSTQRHQGQLVFDPFHPRLRTDPYGFYEELRLQDPIHRSPFGMWIITRYEDVLTLLRHPDTSNRPSAQSVHSRPDRAASPAKRLADNLFALLDGPDHIRLRRHTDRAFKKHFEKAESSVEDNVTRLLAKARAEGGMDLVEDFASPLPVWVISDYLGLPESDRPFVESYAHDLFYIFSPGMEDDIPRRLNRAVLELEGYFREWVAHYRRSPKDGLLADLITLADRGDISETELIASCLLLFSNGAETVAHMIGSSTLALFHHPHEMERLRRQPELMASAVEECLRFESPSMIISKNSGSGLVLNEVVIPPQDPIFAVVGSANRDPSVFENPHTLQLDREPNKHLSFSSGRHSCLGASLARTQAKVALSGLLALPGLKLDGEPRWKESITLRGLESLPVLL